MHDSVDNMSKIAYILFVGTQSNHKFQHKPTTKYQSEWKNVIWTFLTTTDINQHKLIDHISNEKKFFEWPAFFHYQHGKQS